MSFGGWCLFSPWRLPSCPPMPPATPFEACCYPPASSPSLLLLPCSPAAPSLLSPSLLPAAPLSTSCSRLPLHGPRSNLGTALKLPNTVTPPKGPPRSVRRVFPPCCGVREERVFVVAKVVANLVARQYHHTARVCVESVCLASQHRVQTFIKPCAQGTAAGAAVWRRRAVGAA